MNLPLLALTDERPKIALRVAATGRAPEVAIIPAIPEAVDEDEEKAAGNGGADGADKADVAAAGTSCHDRLPSAELRWDNSGHVYSRNARLQAGLAVPATGDQPVHADVRACNCLLSVVMLPPAACCLYG